MSELILWKNQELGKLRKDMDRVFERCCSSFGIDLWDEEPPGGFPIAMTETGDAIVVEVSMPGVDPESLEVTVSDGDVRIKGERVREVEERGEGYHRVERSYGSFAHTIPLPCKVITEDITATYKAGLLRLSMTKREPARSCGVKVNVC